MCDLRGYGNRCLWQRHFTPEYQYQLYVNASQTAVSREKKLRLPEKESDQEKSKQFEIIS